MKIILACGIFPPDIGGPATYADKLAGELNRLGHEVVVLTYRDKTISKLETRNSKLQLVIVSRKFPKLVRHFVYFWKLFWLASTADVIYAQNAVSAGLPAALAAGILKKRLVLKVVGDAAWERARERGKTNDSLEEFQNKPHSLMINFLAKTQHYISRKADAIIAPSVYLKNIVQGWGIKEGKIKVVYNSPETMRGGPPSNTKEVARQYKEKVLHINTDEDVILTVGRLVPWKGFEVLIELMPQLLVENPNFKLFIVGEGEEREKLEAKARALCLLDAVKLEGRIEHSQIAFYLGAADIFILNSQYEGLSHIILEAMRYSPVIASNKGGNPELIEDGVNGLLVEYNNKEQIKEAILKLWRDKALREKFVANSKEKLKQFSFDLMLEQTLTILSK